MCLNGTCGCAPPTVHPLCIHCAAGSEGGRPGTALTEGSFPGCSRGLRPPAQSTLMRATCKAHEGTLPGCSPALGAPGEVDAGWWHLHLLPGPGVQHWMRGPHPSLGPAPQSQAPRAPGTQPSWYAQHRGDPCGPSLPPCPTFRGHCERRSVAGREGGATWKPWFAGPEGPD